ncbi:MAG: peptidoglycan editing factor PgeF [Verrucomicrobia bacterium]|nr:peptidoglycan editing factor PgeF [Verrucomicrobiota bacterium]
MEMEKTKLEWIEYELLEDFPHVVHGTFSRHGGVSEGPYATLNLGEGTSDKPDRVKANREIVRRMLDLKQLVFPHQVHGTIVHRVTAKNLDKVVQCDALFTTEKSIGLGVIHADCQGAIFYDPVHEAVAIAHCGWRGSAQNLYSRVVDTMRREIGTQAHNLIVCISPSLGPDHAEFKNYKQELPQEFWEYQVKPLYFDFWAISRMQLAACGIPEKNIEIAEVCTVCTPEDYFSYRREKDSGRNATIVALKG